ncbi:MAG: toprim domain-containing protein [Clostridiales bacterium]|nr:toprim domain-containing protein [Clostridiales bacterium]
MQLVISEKPSVGMALAKALGATEKKDGHVLGTDHIVSWCAGHLVGLANADVYDEKFKKWNIADLLISTNAWEFVVSEDKNEQFNVLGQLMEDSRVTKVVNACDAGREGELIFRIVYNNAGCTKPIKRLFVKANPFPYYKAR